ncbi:MAG: DNA (cytosine-5-)-methyltransferase [Phycisphaerae bacterium]
MNILSLFDGISCGRVALERGGHRVHKYFASEIDKYAISISQKNYPDIIQLGNIEKWREWDIDWATINLLIAGSPCQGFSFAGKGLNFEDQRSKLFFVFVDILRHIKKLNSEVKFLLENVRMKGEYELAITRTLDTLPVYINSALVSAQNRQRVYWTNIPGDDMFAAISQPEDKHIFLKNILENGLPARAVKYGKIITEHNAMKGCCCCATDYKGLENRQESSISIVGFADIKGQDIIRRVYGINGKYPTLTAVCGGQQQPKISNDGCYYRRLTPTEYERLQTLPDGYTQGISNSRRYHALGNGWTIDVIVHILKGLKGAK